MTVRRIDLVMARALLVTFIIATVIFMMTTFTFDTLMNIWKAMISFVNNGIVYSTVKAMIDASQIDGMIDFQYEVMGASLWVMGLSAMGMGIAVYRMFAFDEANS